ERVAIPRLELRAHLRSEFIQKFHTVLGRIILDPRLRLREAASNPSPIDFRGRAIQDAGVPEPLDAPRHPVLLGANLREESGVAIRKGERFVLWQRGKLCEFEGPTLLFIISLPLVRAERILCAVVDVVV